MAKKLWVSEDNGMINFTKKYPLIKGEGLTKGRKTEEGFYSLWMA